MIKLALIVPSDNFINNCNEIAQQHNATNPDYKDEEFVFEEIVVDKDSRGRLDIRHVTADVLMARGLYYEIIRQQNQHIPLVEVPVPAVDLIDSIQNSVFSSSAYTVGVIASGNMLAEISKLSSIHNTKIITYELKPKSDCQSLVTKALSDGCNLICGSIKALLYASTLNIPTLPIATSKESFWNCLTAAKQVAKIGRDEQEKSTYLRMMLESNNDGIMFIDYQKKITMVNGSVSRILKLDEDVTYKRIEETDIPLEIKKILILPHEYQSELVTIEGEIFCISKKSVFINSRYCGSIITIQNATDVQMFERKLRQKIYHMGHFAQATFSDIIGEAPITKAAINKAQRYAATHSPILLIGNSGTGKELFAQSIHNSSQRKDGPFVAVNCAAIPESLMESEFFGYVDGAFTGANKKGKIGFFEAAHGGTIFLDEIGEVPMHLQPKFLRALQEKKIMRVGDSKVISVDVRVVSATNKNLMRLVEEKVFREDLYYRLNVLRVSIPSLKQRTGDIKLLAENYFKRHYPDLAFEPDALILLSGYHWPGNIRQLFSFCERIGVSSGGDYVKKSDIYNFLQEELGDIDNEDTKFEKVVIESSYTPDRQDIVKILQKNSYHKGKAAKELGIDRTTLWRKMKEFNIS